MLIICNQKDHYVVSPWDNARSNLKQDQHRLTPSSTNKMQNNRSTSGKSRFIPPLQCPLVQFEVSTTDYKTGRISWINHKLTVSYFSFQRTLTHHDHKSIQTTNKSKIWTPCHHAVQQNVKTRQIVNHSKYTGLLETHEFYTISKTATSTSLDSSPFDLNVTSQNHTHTPQRPSHTSTILSLGHIEKQRSLGCFQQYNSMKSWIDHKRQFKC